MKTKSLFFAMLIALSSTALAFENDKPEMTVVPVKGAEVFKVIYRGSTTGNVKLNIFDGQQRMIHTEAIRGLNGFIIPVNFKGLDFGTYTIELVSETKTYREQIDYLPTQATTSVHISRLSGDESKFLVAVSNAQNEPITVTIYDAAERIVFDESTVINGDSARVFKIAQAHGRYRFEVSDSSGNKRHFSF